MGIRRKSSCQVEERIEAGHQEEVLMPGREKNRGWASGGSPHSRERKEYRLGIRRKSSFQVEERIEAGHQEKGIMPCR